MRVGSPAPPSAWMAARSSEFGASDDSVMDEIRAPEDSKSRRPDSIASKSERSTLSRSTTALRHSMFSASSPKTSRDAPVSIQLRSRRLNVTSHPTGHGSSRGISGHRRRWCATGENDPNQPFARASSCKRQSHNFLAPARYRLSHRRAQMARRDDAAQYSCSREIEDEIRIFVGRRHEAKCGKDGRHHRCNLSSVIGRSRTRFPVA
jgi:hypothetical protein